MPDDVWIRDDFRSALEIQSLIACVRLRQQRGEFHTARVGGGGDAQTRADIRGDSTCWLGEPLYPAEHALLACLEALRLDLNRTHYLGLFDLELHYASYPMGAGYARHVDRPQGREQRLVSVVLYLNEEWPAGAGGELRVYGGAGQHRDIAPIAGRLVWFLTAGCEHEVLPASRERLSVSGWFLHRAA